MLMFFFFIILPIAPLKLRHFYAVLLLVLLRFVKNSREEEGWKDRVRERVNVFVCVCVCTSMRDEQRQKETERLNLSLCVASLLLFG